MLKMLKIIAVIILVVKPVFFLGSYFGQYDASVLNLRAIRMASLDLNSSLSCSRNYPINLAHLLEASKFFEVFKGAYKGMEIS